MTETRFRARQSLLRSMEVCPRRTWHGIQLDGLTVEDTSLTVGYTESSADLGTALHAVAAEILRTLWSTNETQMPGQEAVEVAYEVYAGMDHVLPAQEFDDLVWLTLRFAERTWEAHRTIAIEERIDVPLLGQDEELRTLSCQPDWISVWGSTLLVCDWKSGRGKPKEPREHQADVPADVAVGMAYLSDRGHFQADCYSLAALHRYPAAERVVFREYHLRSGQIREVRLERAEMEHVARQVGVHLQKLDRAIAEGPDSAVWRPRPGKHCAKQCPVARSCPVPAEQRGMGAIETDEMADAEAARYVALDAVRGQMRDALKARFEATGRGALIGDGREIRWDGGKGSAFEIVDVERDEVIS